MSKTHSALNSFGYAINGIKEAIKNEPNIRVHLIIGLIAVIVAYFLKFNRTEWIILVFTISFVLNLELINTALEAIVDIVSPQIQRKAKIAKDVAAAAVLISAILAIIVGLFLFLPKILTIKAL